MVQIYNLLSNIRLSIKFIMNFCDLILCLLYDAVDCGYKTYEIVAQICMFLWNSGYYSLITTSSYTYHFSPLSFLTFKSFYYMIIAINLHYVFMLNEAFEIRDYSYIHCCFAGRGRSNWYPTA